MAELPLGRADYARSVPKEARIQTRNRYYETNPVLTDTGVALLSRPALKRYAYVGNGPIRAVYSQPGDFEEAVFVVSGTQWFRVDLNGVATLIQSGINSPGTPIMAATGPIGTTPSYMYLADGKILYCYIENGYATGSISGAPANGNVVKITDGVTPTYYQFTTGSVNAGTPAGTLAAPWLVAVGGTPAASWSSFGAALSAAGAPGVDYSTLLQANTFVQQTSTSANVAYVRANAVGLVGNNIQTTVTSGTIAWAAATLTGGGSPSVFQVAVPGAVGVISLGYIASYVVVVPAQGLTINGRFYWINPGDTSINALDFATAERSPDPIFGVVVFGDQFWLPGSNTTEVWYFTGNINAPVQRLQGVTFDRGTWKGTALQVKESMIIVDSDGGVFQIAGGLARISNASIEERIRTAILYQSYLGY